MRQLSLYIFAKKNVALHFSVYRKLLLNGTLLIAEICTTYRTFCSVSTVKNSAKSNELLQIY